MKYKTPLNIAIETQDKKKFQLWAVENNTNPSEHLRWYILKLLTDANFRSHIESLLAEK